VAVTEFISCRPNLEVDDLAPAAAFLREVLGFEVEVDEPEMGLMLLRRDAVGLALVQSPTPGVNATTAAYIGVTGVDDLHERCTAAAHGSSPDSRTIHGACATSWSRYPAATGWHSANGSHRFADALAGFVRGVGALLRDARDYEFAGLEGAFRGHGGQFVTQ
jgi:hypothetical protein